ncbi:TPA: hypothetical protein DEG21_03570 [Patescibacteria group bacterium]|nr:hypothetical protein [Candidatus Gracilibacteria bacterium]HBY74933.1 hypothetical protein [Candidatus Gracilibacteria bacterium]
MKNIAKYNQTHRFGPIITKKDENKSRVIKYENKKTTALFLIKSNTVRILHFWINSRSKASNNGINKKTKTFQNIITYFLQFQVGIFLPSNPLFDIFSISSKNLYCEKYNHFYEKDK